MTEAIDKNFQIKLHKNGKYNYASTQPFFGIENGKRIYKRLHWGIVDENLKFLPNKEFQLLSKREKNKFKFPETWDLSEVYTEKQKINNQSYNKLYGETWLLNKISEQLGIKDDLMTVFKDKETVDAILTLAYYRICSDDSYSHINSWQKITKVPYDFEMNEVFITRLTKKITENDKLKFLKLRLNRIDKNEICAIDSTSISCTSDTFVDAFLGYNKENDTMLQTNEVVVYGLNSKLPLYYRTVPGNMKDNKSLKTIVNDLAAIGLEKCLMITDRGYPSQDNIEYYKQNKIPFITGIKTNDKNVVDFLSSDYDLNTIFIPTKMDCDEHTGVFGQQYCLDTLKNGLRLNVYINVNRRTSIFVETNRLISRQRKLLEKLESTGHRCDKPLITKICSYFKVEFKKVGKSQTVKSFTFDIMKYQQYVQLAGIFASVSYMVDKDVHEINELYHKRSEQEKIFMFQKSGLNSRRHRTSTEATKIGRNFILFISSILVCQLQKIRKQHFGNTYFDLKSMLREMRSIRYITHPNRDDFITPFIARQKEISEAFGFEVPDDSTPTKKFKLKIN